MIYKFSDFENIKEYNYYNLDNNYMLYENDYLSMATKLESTTLKTDFANKLMTIIKDKSLADKILVQTEALNLFNVSKQLVGGTYTNWSNIGRNVAVGVLALGFIVLAIRKGIKNQNNKDIIEKVDLGTQKLKDVINKDMQVSLKTAFKDPSGVTLVKGTVGKLSTEIRETTVNNTIVKNTTTIFTPITAIISNNAKVTKSFEISSYSPSLAKIILSKVKVPMSFGKESWEFFKTHYGKLASFGCAVFIVSRFSESIEALIEGIQSNIYSFDIGSSVAELRELQALATKDGKQAFISSLKTLIEETSQFEKDLGFSNDFLGTITSDSFANDSKNNDFSQIGNKPENIGYLVSYLLAEQCYNFIMGNVKAITIAKIENTSAIQGE